MKEVMESEVLRESKQGTVRVMSVRELRWISAEQDEGPALCTDRSVRDSLGSVTKPDSTPKRGRKEKRCERLVNVG